MRNPPAELRKFLRAYDTDIAKLFFATRAAVLEAAPKADELIYDAYNAVAAAYTFSGRLKEAFCHVAAYAKYVNLGFNQGASLPDPSRVLAGSGRRIRHVRISSVDDLKRPAVRRLLDAAVRQARSMTRTPATVPRSIVRPSYPVKRRPLSKRA